MDGIQSGGGCSGIVAATRRSSARVVGSRRWRAILSSIVEAQFHNKCGRLGCTKPQMQCDKPTRGLSGLGRPEVQCQQLKPVPKLKLYATRPKRVSLAKSRCGEVIMTSVGLGGGKANPVARPEAERWKEQVSLWQVRKSRRRHSKSSHALSTPRPSKEHRKIRKRPAVSSRRSSICEETQRHATSLHTRRSAGY